jgi:hypothetical protein
MIIIFGVFDQFSAQFFLNFLINFYHKSSILSLKWPFYNCIIGKLSKQRSMVARMYIFKPKILICVNLARSCNGNVGIFYKHLIFFTAIWYILWTCGIFHGYLVQTKNHISDKWRVLELERLIYSMVIWNEHITAIWYILWAFGSLVAIW